MQKMKSIALFSICVALMRINRGLNGWDLNDILDMLSNACKAFMSNACTTKKISRTLKANINQTGCKLALDSV